MKRESGEDIHPAIPGYVAQLKAGALDRRGFLSAVARLGLTGSAALAVAGLAPGPRAFAAAPKKGGDFRVSMNIKEAGDPAIY
ncbi:MAG: diguanylate cyclase, partial [Rhodospirillaceae bacterium]|nr:diguanylate cyclase [Rhodospirillaceae bacterium]